VLTRAGICVPPAVPRFRLNTYSRRAFSVAGPMAWNSLPDFIRDPTSSTDCLGIYLKRTCSRDTSALSALGVLNDYALYKSTYSLISAVLAVQDLRICTCKSTLCPNKNVHLLFFLIFQSEVSQFYNFWCTRIVNTLTISAILLI